jgi:cob(I)alamin adenosyltransferase
MLHASSRSAKAEPMTNRSPGLIHVYTGDGKGKTTAALGLALRAAGHGWRTYIGQFMKGQEYGELQAGALLDGRITIEQFGRPTFIRVDADGHSTATKEDVTLAKKGLDAIRNAMSSGQYQIVVMDEINVALYFKLLAVQEVVAVVEDKPASVELVLTGRRVPQVLLDRADYVTEMTELKHPYQRGIKARQGIEF